MASAPKSRPRIARHAPPAARPRRKRRWLRYLVAAFAGPLLLIVGVLGYYYVTLSRVIEARLHGEVERSWPRIYGRRRGYYEDTREDAVLMAARLARDLWPGPR